MVDTFELYFVVPYTKYRSPGKKEFGDLNYS